ncbi:MAG: glycosyltransferase family 2 protein [Sphaerochaeta sp.]|uniref:glycosyltransferase family 2 protein n=1 Tax=Sphaerochaeta sp. TaxID=1972642 RepID=UPI003D0B9708
MKSRCSVIIPAYNCAATVRSTVESVCAQTYDDLEILIADDASTDDTLALLTELAGGDDRIRVIPILQNGGVANARNVLFSHASGEYLAFLDSDDLWLPEKLEKQIALLETSGADLVYSSYDFINEMGKQTGKTNLVPKQCTFSALLKENFILPSTVVMRTSSLQNHRMDGNYAHEDYVFWLSLLQDGRKAVGNPEVLVHYRIDASSRSANKRKAAKNRWIVYRRFLHLNRLASTWYFCNYAFHGIIKYKGLRTKS